MNKLRLLGSILTECRPAWPVVADRFGWLQPGRIYPVCYGEARFHARGRVGDFAVLNEIFLHRSYDLALRTLQPGSTVLDIGANIGAFTVAALLAGAGTVHAFEPLPENLEMVRRHVELNGLKDRVRLDGRAVSGDGRPATFHFNPKDAGGGTFFPAIHTTWRDGEKSGARTMTVECLRLPDVLRLMPSGCDLLKMDCEGAEHEIVRSLAECSDLVKAVVFEFHSDGKLEDTLAMLRSYGFVHIQQAKPYQVILATR